MIFNPKLVRKTETGHCMADFLHASVNTGICTSAKSMALKKSLLPGSDRRVNFGFLLLALFFE